MILQTASRKRVKIKCALQGPSGSGKTKSSLLIAYGLCCSWGKIAVIDTENRSSELYSDIGAFKVIHLEPPFVPEKYIEAINVCLKAEMEVIIVDSLTHEWETILDIHSQIPGNSYTNWNKVTPRHNAFINTMLQADVHIIGTIRTKQDYVLSDKNGKQVPEKVGLKGVQREGMDYEFTLVLDLDMSLNAKVSKDRTQLFFKQPEFIPTIETGQAILAWCNEGEIPDDALISQSEVIAGINACATPEELNKLFQSLPMYQITLKHLFTSRKMQLQKNNVNHLNQ